MCTFLFLLVCETAVVQGSTHSIRECCYGIFIQEVCFIFDICLQKLVLRSFSSPNLSRLQFKDVETKDIHVFYIFVHVSFITCVMSPNLLLLLFLINASYISRYSELQLWITQLWVKLYCVSMCKSLLELHSWDYIYIYIQTAQCFAIQKHREYLSVCFSTYIRLFSSTSCHFLETEEFSWNWYQFL